MRHNNLYHLHGFPWLYILLKKWECVHESRFGNMNNISRQEPWMWSCALLPNEENEDSGELSAIPHYYQNSVKLWQTVAKQWSTSCFISTIIIIEQTCGRPRVFGGDLDDFFEATRELIPPVVKSCIDTIRRLLFFQDDSYLKTQFHRLGMNHQGIFRIGGAHVSNFEINILYFWLLD